MASSSRPLSSLPAFPVIVALWFAALLGAGTFVLPATIFENAACATGLSDIVPAAQPPLGDTARLAISAAAAVLGALIGLFVAWQIRRASRSMHKSDASEDLAPNPGSDESSDRDEMSDGEGSTAWQLWREKMAADADAYEADAARDPDDDDYAADSGADFSRLDAMLSEEDGYLPSRDDETDGAALDTAASPEDDPQRAEADRLVAGLARIPRETDGARAFSPAEPSSPDIDSLTVPPIEQSDAETLSFRDESEDTSIFDPSFLSAPSVQAIDMDDAEFAEDVAIEPDRPDEASAASREPLETLSLPELVARLELAIDAIGTGGRREDAEPANDTGGESGADTGDRDPQAMLKDALARLDAVEGQTV